MAAITKHTETIGQIQINPDQIISNGLGEYILYKKAPSGEKELLSEEVYRKIYDILRTFSLSSLPETSEIKKWSQQYQNREQIILNQVKKIDSNMEMTFFPRTLYELLLIHECIEEDVQTGKICEALNPLEQKLLHYPRFKINKVFEKKVHKIQKELKSKLEKKNCWHVCYFEDAGDDKLEEVKIIAFRLNQIAVKKIGAHVGSLSYQKISQLVESEIDYLKNHHKHCTEKLEKGDASLSSCNYPGPTTNFGYESERGSIKPSGVRSDKDAQIIRNVIALECSEIARKNIFLFRGATCSADKPYLRSDELSPFSLSYGTDLFGGVMYDGGASAYHYMRKEFVVERDLSQEKNHYKEVPQDAYAIQVPIEEIFESPFYIPLIHPICQLFGNGEIFHARTKVWEGTTSKPSGVQGDARWEHLKCNLKRSELVERFQKYYKQNLIFFR